MNTTQSKLKMEIIKDGKRLKYVETNPSHTGQAGYFTDTYRDEQGYLHYIDRMANAIKFTTHSRKTGDGNMISFVINFKNLIEGVLNCCDDEELDKLIKKCEYSLSKAKEGYVRENPENGNEVYAKAVEQKVSESIDEFTLKQPTQAHIESVERIINTERVKENDVFKSSLCIKINDMSKTETEVEFDESTEPIIE